MYVRYCPASRFVPGRIAEDPRALIWCRRASFPFFTIRPLAVCLSVCRSVGPACEISLITFLTRLIPSCPDGIAVLELALALTRLPWGWMADDLGLNVSDPSINRHYVQVIVIHIVVMFRSCAIYIFACMTILSFRILSCRGKSWCMFYELNCLQLFIQQLRVSFAACFKNM